TVATAPPRTACSRCLRSIYDDIIQGPGWAPVPRAGESEELLDVLVDDLFGVRPDDTVDELALLVEEERRDAHDPERAGLLPVVIAVELPERHLSLVPFAQPVYDGGDHPARTAPRRQHVDDGDAAVGGELVEMRSV